MVAVVSIPPLFIAHALGHIFLFSRFLASLAGMITDSLTVLKPRLRFARYDLRIQTLRPSTLAQLAVTSSMLPGTSPLPAPDTHGA